MTKLNDCLAELFALAIRQVLERMQQRQSDASPLILLRHGRPSQDSHWHRILPHPVADALGGIQRIDLTDSVAEITSYPVLGGRDGAASRSTPALFTKMHTDAR